MAVVINRFFTFNTRRVSINISNSNSNKIKPVIAVFIFLTVIIVVTIITLSIVSSVANNQIKVKTITVAPLYASTSNIEHKTVAYASKNNTFFFVVIVPGDKIIY